MQNLNIIDKIKGSNFIKKLIDNLKPGSFIAFDGPTFSGKSVILEQTKIELEKKDILYLKLI